MWCVQKDDYTAVCKLCNKDIYVEYNVFRALKQHSEKQKHKEFHLIWYAHNVAQTKDGFDIKSQTHGVQKQTN